MKITISELMRLRREISNVISQGQYIFQSCNYGETFSDDVNITNKSNDNFNNIYLYLCNLLDINLLINDTIEQFNCYNKIGSLVREKSNNEMKLRILEDAVKRSKATETVSFVIVGSERKSIKNKYVPFTDKKILKESIKQLKLKNRKIQSDIDVANASIIDIDIEYEDIEEFISQFKN